MSPGKLGLRQELRQVLAPEMLQLLKLLQLPTLELQQLVRQELEINPMLEEVLEGPDREGEETPEPEEPVTPELDKIDWRDYLQDGIDDRCLQSLENSDESEGPIIPQRETFQDYLLFQLRMATSDPKLLPIGEYLIGSLNDDGYLLQPLEEVAQAISQELESVQTALGLVQSLDPPGVGCRDLRECLLIQLNLLGQGQSLAAQIVSRHLTDLEHQRYPVIARSLGVLESQVLQARELIASLSPKPGSGFSSEEPQYVYPDLIIERRDGQYQVTINDREVPKVRLTSGYRQILSQARKSSPQDREYVTKRLEAARFIVRMIEQRRRTLTRIMESIIARQSDFLEKGIRHIKPLTMKQIAQDIQMHESTVSRAVHNKYVITPNGMLPVRYFFGVGLKSGSGEDSTKSIKDKIAEMISQEDPRKPLSDQEVADRLSGQSVEIARRTVAKYREELKILPAKLRRRRD